MAGALDGLGRGALMAQAGAGDAALQNPAPVGYQPAQARIVFIIYMRNFIYAERADLPAHDAAASAASALSASPLIAFLGSFAISSITG